MGKLKRGNEVLLVCYGRHAGKHKAVVTKSGSKYIHVQCVDSEGEPWGIERQFEANTLFSTNTTGARDYIIPADKILKYEAMQRLDKKKAQVSSLLKEHLHKLDEREIDRLIEILNRE